MNQQFPDAFQSSMSTKSLSYAAYRRLEEMIVMLELAPGVIVRECDLTELTGYGRTPVRDAMKRLADDALVTIIPRRGALIAEIDIRQQMSVAEFRRPLEQMLSTLASNRRTDEEAQTISDLSQRMEAAIKANDVAAYLAADREYKRAVCRAARNPFLARSIDAMHSISRRFWYVEYKKTDEMGPTVGIQLKIMRAIIAGDAEAAAAASNAYMDKVEVATRRSIELD